MLMFNCSQLMGPLMICGFIQFLAWLAGLVGVLMRFIGPITIVPTLLLIGISSVEPAVSYAEVHWGITCL